MKRILAYLCGALLLALPATALAETELPSATPAPTARNREDGVEFCMLLPQEPVQ